MVSRTWKGRDVLTVLCFYSYTVGVLSVGLSTILPFLLLLGIGYHCGELEKTLGSRRRGKKSFLKGV